MIHLPVSVMQGLGKWESPDSQIFVAYARGLSIKAITFAGLFGLDVQSFM